MTQGQTARGVMALGDVNLHSDILGGFPLYGSKGEQVAETGVEQSTHHQVSEISKYNEFHRRMICRAASKK